MNTPLHVRTGHATLGTDACVTDSGYAFRLEADPRGWDKWLRKSSVDMTEWFTIAARGNESETRDKTSRAELERVKFDQPRTGVRRLELRV